MLLGIFSFIRSSFRWKLALYGMAMVLLPTIVYSIFLDYELGYITDFSLARYTASTEQLVEEYLTKYTNEKAQSTAEQILDSQANLTVLGRTAQKIVDSYDELQSNPGVFDLSLFNTPLEVVDGALTSGPSTQFDAFAPPPIAGEARASAILTTSALLNLNMDALFESDKNDSFVYFVGDRETPVTRAYPNIDLATVLGEAKQSLFWQDFFAENPDSWSRWYTDPELQAQVPSPVTMEPPYEDAAQQGLTVTMFYPLWDKVANQFAGAVGLDITLSNIIQNILGITIGESGFAFLINGKGDVIAMPEAGYELFGLETSTLQRGDLIYSVVPMTSSTNSAVAAMTATLLDSDQGILRFTPTLTVTQTATQTEGSSEQQDDGYLVTYSSLPPFYDSQYQEDQWTFVAVVPESEVFAVQREIDTQVGEERLRLSQRSLALVAGFSVVAFLLAAQLSKTVTRDLRTLSHAAEKISAKEYDIDIPIKSIDEVGQLGIAFTSMSREIRDYTTNLEDKILSRTKDLQQANVQITRLNAQLKDENLRLSAELDVARHLQTMVLPSDAEMKLVDELDIAGYSQPADEVGGDYYDVMRNGDALYLGIGDVTGHGLPAGVIMLMAQTALLTLVQAGEKDPSRMMTVLNQVLYHNIIRIHDDKSMTMAVFRYKDNVFELAGQHESVLIFHANTNGDLNGDSHTDSHTGSNGDSIVEEINTLETGFPLGLDDDISALVSERLFRLVKGDVMVLYTDGITEAENSQGELYGIVRLKELLATCGQLESKQILQRILDEVYEFVGDTRIYDDISALVVKQK